MAQQTHKDDALSWKDLQDHALWWVRLFYQSIRFCLHVLKKRPALSFGSMSVGALLLLGYLHLNAQLYEMSTTFAYGDLHPKIFGDMVNKLNALLQSERDDKVAELMHLTIEQVEKIQRVQVSDIQGKSLENNYTLGKEPMIVTLTLTDPIPEDSLRQAITGYFNSNPFTADRLSLKQRLLREELNYVNRKLKTTDSILSKLYTDGSRGMIEDSRITIENSEGKNAYELLSFSRELVQRKKDIENNLALPENVIAIDNFILLPKARFTPGSAIKYGILGAILGFLFALVLVFWLERLRPMVEKDDYP